MGGTSGRLCTVAERHAASGSLMPVTPRPWSAWICTRGRCDPTGFAHISEPFSKEKITPIKRAILTPCTMVDCSLCGALLKIDACLATDVPGTKALWVFCET